MPRPVRMDQLADDALLAAVGLGDPQAAVVFVRRFQHRVFGLATTIVNDRSLADDVAQQTFERAWRHAGSYDARRGSVVVWLLAITRHQAIDALRVRRAEPLGPADLADLLPESVMIDPLRAAVASDTLERLRFLVRQLPIEQQRAVLLATLAGRTMAEIGEIEGIPVPTAKTRLRAGLGKLQVAMIGKGLR